MYNSTIVGWEVKMDLHTGRLDNISQEGWTKAWLGIMSSVGSIDGILPSAPVS
jgi:hypothetical protein